MDFENIYKIIEESLNLSFGYILNPNKRVYLGYIFTSLLLALYVYKTNKVHKTFFKYIYNKQVWFSKSAFIDYSFVVFNGFVKVIFIGPYLILWLYGAYYLTDYLTVTFGEFNSELPKVYWLVFYTLSVVVVQDFFSFLVHYLMHKIPFMWEFHKTHHSATSLNIVTQYRLHPVELIINNSKSLMVFALVSGLFVYLSGGSLDKISVIGVNVLHLVFLVFGSNLRHSQVPLKYNNKVELLFISPFQHQIHHSDNPEHFDKNMGSKLAIWDWMFGTLLRSGNRGKLTYGLGEEQKKYNSFVGNLIQPFLWLVLKIFKK